MSPDGRLTLRIVLLVFSLTFWALAHFYGHRQGGTGQSDMQQTYAGPLFQGDMYATMPQNGTPQSSYAEDQARAQSAVTWVRVIFEKESQPQFADLVKSALQKKWNPNLGYQLVFGESQGSLEDAATAVTCRMTVQPHSQVYHITDSPYPITDDRQQSLFSSVDVVVHASPGPGIKKMVQFPPNSWTLNPDDMNPVPTSWDHVTLASACALPQNFKFHAGQFETINRRQLGTLYQDFAKKLDELPEFCFFPDKDFDHIRDLYSWTAPGETNKLTLDPLEFAEITKELVGTYEKKSLNRHYLDALCIHLITAGATNYVDGISTVLCEWSPYLSDERRQFLTDNLSFANYSLMETLLSHHGNYQLFQTIPRVWDDPGLAWFSRNYWRTNANSPELRGMAGQYADKLRSAPVYNSSQMAGGQSGHQPMIIILPPRSASAHTNHLASAQPISARTGTAQ